MKRNVLLLLLSFTALACGENNSEMIDKTQFKIWPFSVDKGLLKCEHGVITFEVDGIVYGVNGYGQQEIEGKGGHKIEEIWLIDEKKVKELVAVGVPRENAISRISIGEILEHVQKLCKE